MEQYWEGAKCAGYDANLFVSDNRGHTKLVDIYNAKQVCRGCPIREKCLDYAIRNDMQGVWGGTTESDRDLMRRSHKLLTGRNW